MQTSSLCFLFISVALVSCPSSEAVDVTAKNVDYSDTCIAMLKRQIQREVEASLNYLVMGQYFNRDSVNRPGFAKFFFDSASEERTHAKKMLQYLNMRGDTLDAFYHSVGIRKLEWESGRAALEEALDMEKSVTDHIKNIAVTCMDAKEEHLADYLISDFLNEQLEGQRQLSGYINRIKKLGDHQDELKEFLFDQTLQKEAA